MDYTYQSLVWQCPDDNILLHLYPTDDFPGSSLTLSWDEGLRVAERLIEHAVRVIEPRMKSWSDTNGVPGKRIFQELVFKLRSLRRVFEEELPGEITMMLDAPFPAQSHVRYRADTPNSDDGHTDEDYSVRVKSLYAYAALLEGNSRRYAESFSGFLTGMNQEWQPVLYHVGDEEAVIIRHTLRAIWETELR